MKYLISVFFVFLITSPTFAISYEDEAFCKNISYEIGKYYIAMVEGGVPAETLIDNILETAMTEKERRWFIWAVVNFDRIPDDTKFSESQIQLTTVIRCVEEKIKEEKIEE